MPNDPRVFGRFDKRFGGDILGGRVKVLGDVPILAEVAVEIAAFGADRKYALAGMEMVEGLLLDGIERRCWSSCRRPRRRACRVCLSGYRRSRGGLPR